MDWNLGTAARTLYQEARGEPVEGQQAVAHVIVNRLRARRWGTTFDEVCRAQHDGVFQFSGWRNGDPNHALACRLPDNDTLLVQLAGFITNAVNGDEDPTGGALYYYNPALAAPDWDFSKLIRCGRFGAQLFFKDAALS